MYNLEDRPSDGEMTIKRRDLEQQLTNLGWWFLRHGGKHDIWTNGRLTTAIPRHSEISRGTARKILATAKEDSE